MRKLNKKGFAHIELIVILVVILGIVAAGFYVYNKSKTKNNTTVSTTKVTTTKVFTKTTASQVINEFNLAMQKGDAAEVLALESPSFQNTVKTLAASTHKQLSTVPITDNYYNVCIAVGQFCTYDWSAKNLDDAKVTTSSYKASDGTVGLKETFTTTVTTATSTPAGSSTTTSTGSETVTESGGSSTSSGSSTTTFGIDAIPHGNTWLIDNMDGGSDSASGNFSL